MVVSTPNHAAPARDYPNMNTLLGIRFYYNATPVTTPGGVVQKPSSGLILNKPMVIGTVPGRAFVVGGTVHVKVATAGVATLDIGTAEDPIRFVSAGALSTLNRDDDLMKTKIGLIAEGDTPIIATLRGSNNLTGGIFSVLLYYYAKLD